MSYFFDIKVQYHAGKLFLHHLTERKIGFPVHKNSNLFSEQRRHFSHKTHKTATFFIFAHKVVNQSK
jgi:hypothetical protein